jgi:glycosyltransferase involved in cell wall biosynthesis
LRALPESGLVVKVLLLAHRYWPAVGGVESFVRHLAVGLSERHEVTVLALRTDDGAHTRLTTSLTAPAPFTPFRDGSVSVEPLRITRREKFLLTPLAAQVVPVFRRYAYGRARVPLSALYARVIGPVIQSDARHADILHVLSNDVIAEAGVRAARAAGIPCLVTPFAHANQYGTGPADVAAYRKADRVVALLEEEASVYRGLGVDAGLIDVTRVCSPGVEAGHGDEVRARFGVGGPVVLFLGVRRAYKGVDLLLEAAPQVAADRPDVTFVFAGPGDPIRQSSAPGTRVLDVGVLDERERAAWLDAADLLCLPSEAEIFPGSFLEAWSVGTPVLASDIPTLRELVRVSGGGETVRRDSASIAAAIRQLMSDPGRLRALGEQGRTFWETECTVEAVAEWHERLYGSLLGPAGQEAVPVTSHA